MGTLDPASPGPQAATSASPTIPGSPAQGPAGGGGRGRGLGVGRGVGEVGDEDRVRARAGRLLDGGGPGEGTHVGMRAHDQQVLHAELRQEIAQDLVNAGQPGEKLSETIVYEQPQFHTDHNPGDSVASFSGTMPYGSIR